MQNKISKQAKQTATNKFKIKDLSIVELIRANSMLSQNCLNLSNHLTKCEMDINSLYHQNLFLKHEIGDLKGVLEVFAMKMGIEREVFEKSSEANGKKSTKELKSLPLHDDLTTRCPACSNVNNKEFKNCVGCGYKNK
jgi:hypothetical protein